MTNTAKIMLGLILASVLILFISVIIGYSIAVQITVKNSKHQGKQIDYLPEKIIKLETQFKSRTGIHFRGESEKLFRCDDAEKECKVILTEPDKYQGKPPFVETKGVYAKFSAPPSKPKQVVFSRSRGLIGHQAATQYVLLEDGKVWYWFYGGNETGDSFPSWRMHNLTPLLLGVLGGVVVGMIISAIVWFRFYPRS